MPREFKRGRERRVLGQISEETEFQNLGASKGVQDVDGVNVKDGERELVIISPQRVMHVYMLVVRGSPSMGWLAAVAAATPASS